MMVVSVQGASLADNGQRSVQRINNADEEALAQFHNAHFVPTRPGINQLLYVVDKVYSGPSQASNKDHSSSHEKKATSCKLLLMFRCCKLFSCTTCVYGNECTCDYSRWVTMVVDCLQVGVVQQVQTAAYEVSGNAPALVPSRHAF